ncbi:CZB domain-containing protein [Thalassovita aquimarina]|uniref:CZB domain-containing protein n=1 Tax=Thalassovita aquimarina TaxID=2785917 RepID=A0ABS5HU73_9RHOB|nr:CZB domain-containing protein [Thalassovita aquimarina]MBR9652521.1 CZB domain-containing protein [Thalassovita aquimarina]
MNNQVMRAELNDALGRHAAWKLRLREAAINGETDLPVDMIKRDDCCKFGKWLRSLPAEARNSDAAKEVHELHANFHIIVGGVAAQIAGGQTDGALAALDGQDYKDSTDRLAHAVTRWRMSLS